MNEETLKIVLNDKSFSKDEAISIVGGLRRFTRLCATGRIRYRKNLLHRMVGGNAMPLM